MVNFPAAPEGSYVSQDLVISFAGPK